MPLLLLCGRSQPCVYLTVSVVSQIRELIRPLRDDTQSIFEESDNNEEASNRWYVAGTRGQSLVISRMGQSSLEAPEIEIHTASQVHSMNRECPQSCSSVVEWRPAGLDHWSRSSCSVQSCSSSRDGSQLSPVFAPLQLCIACISQALDSIVERTKD